MQHRISMLALLAALFAIGLAAGPLPVMPDKGLVTDELKAKELPVIMDQATPPEMGDIDGWNAPVNVSNNTYTVYQTYAYQNPICTDAAGNLYVTWYDTRPSYYHIMVRKWTRATNTWETEMIASSRATSEYVYRSGIAVDNSGNIHVVWYSSTTNYYGIWYNKWDATTQTWGTPTRIYDPGGSYLNYYPSIACRPGGNNIHVAWQQRNAANPTYYNAYHMEFVPGTGWTTPVAVDTGFGYAYDIGVDVDASNNVYITYRQPNYLYSSSYYMIWLVKRTSGVWGNPECVSYPALQNYYMYMPDVAVTPTGAAHVTWYGYEPGESYYKIYYRYRSPAGVWGQVETVSVDPSYYQYYPAIDVKGDTVDVVWSGANVTYPSYRQLMYRRKIGSTWGTREVVTDRSTQYIYYPCVRYAAGDVHATWYDAYSGYNDLWWIRRTPDLVNDVGVYQILSPGQRVSGRTFPVVPQAIVRNYGIATQTNFAVRCTIYDATGTTVRYSNQQTVASLGPGAQTTVTFNNWSPAAYETVLVAMRTVLGGDQDPTNDRASRTSALIQPRYTGGPDAGGYVWIDSDTTGGPTYNWRNIRATGTDVPFSSYDDATAQIPIGFTFNFYGNSYTNLWVCTNGFLNFGATGYTSLGNVTIPQTATPNDMIAVLWDDLHCEGAGKVKYQTLGTSPNCTLVVSWNNIRYYGATDTSISFQALLCQGSNNIILQYADVEGTYPTRDYGYGATVGVENSTGTVGLQYLYGDNTGNNADPFGNLLAANRAIKFGPFVPDRDVAVNRFNLPTYPLVASVAETLSAWVYNYGTSATGPFNVDFKLSGTTIGTAAVSNLGVGESAFVAVEWTPTSAEFRPYFGVKHTFAGDQVPSNDSIGANDWVFPAGTYNAQGFDYITTFPPTGWTVVNADGGTQQWSWYTGAGLEHSGKNFTGCRYETSTLANNDWLITTAFTPSPLTTDTFGYFWHGYWPGEPDTLILYVMSGTTPGDTIQRLVYDWSDSANVHRRIAVCLDNWDGQSIRMGFRYVGTYLWYAFVDDIWWQANYLPVAAPTLVSPANGATGVPLAGNLVWNRVSNAAGYDVYFGTTNPPTTLFADNITDTTVAYTGLANNTPYYWYVEAYNPISSAQSAIWSFTTVAESTPPVPGGWTEITQVPLTPSGKAIKDGGAIAWDAGTGRFFVLKGNKTGDFYSFDGTSWTTLTEIPVGTENKLPAKGANLCTDGNGTVYAVKGNNTQGFWSYSDSTGWTQLADIPLGVSNKKVKGGSDLVYVDAGDSQYVYLLKGYKTEFYRYNIGSGVWQTLTDAPAGVKAKWDKGSWLALDLAGNRIFAHKAKYHELYAYDLATGNWSAQLAGMPLLCNQTGKSKKSKDGAAGAFLADGMLYALKGGNTCDFYAYEPGSNQWAEKETMPQVGSTQKKKRVKGGGDITSDGSHLYALKGNKTVELWRYTPGTVMATAPVRSGVMAGTTVPTVGMTLGPNPLAGGTALLRWSLPAAAPATVQVYDITGRTVLVRSLAAGRTGATSLDLRGLAGGVYLVRLTAGDYTAAQKLVVE